MIAVIHRLDLFIQLQPIIFQHRLRLCFGKTEILGIFLIFYCAYHQIVQIAEDVFLGYPLYARQHRILQARRCLQRVMKQRRQAAADLFIIPVYMRFDERCIILIDEHHHLLAMMLLQLFDQKCKRVSNAINFSVLCIQQRFSDLLIFICVKLRHRRLKCLSVPVIFFAQLIFDRFRQFLLAVLRTGK